MLTYTNPNGMSLARIVPSPPTPEVLPPTLILIKNPVLATGVLRFPRLQSTLTF